MVDSGLVENATMFGDIVGCDDHPRKIHERDSALSEAAGTAVDLKAARSRGFFLLVEIPCQPLGAHIRRAVERGCDELLKARACLFL
jgi:hypothetical protein